MARDLLEAKRRWRRPALRLLFIRCRRVLLTLSGMTLASPSASWWTSWRQRVSCRRCRLSSGRLCARLLRSTLGRGRIAWSMSYTGGDEESLDGSYDMDVEEAAFIREHLAPVAVWPRHDVDRSLDL